MGTLEILSGKAAGTVVDLGQFAGKDKITLGNRRTASVVIKDPWVSFMHAVITQDGAEFLIADKRSKAGTFVNGNKIGQTGTKLKNGDTIALGKTELKFTAGGGGGAAAPAAAAAPAGGGGGGGPFTPVADTSSGPFTPFTPAAAPSSGGGDTSKLEADLRKAESDLASLRAALAQREKLLAETNERCRQLEAGGGDPEVAGKLKSAQARADQLARTVQATTNKATIRIEELTRLNKQLEARLAQGGAADVVAQDKEIARLREEGRKLQDEARLRIQALTKELEESQGGGASSEELAAAQAEAAEAKGQLTSLQDELEKAKESFGQAQSAKMDLEMQVEDLQAEIQKLGKGGGEETAAMEKVITDLNTKLQAANDELMALRAKNLEAAQAPPPAAAPADDGKAQQLEAAIASAQSAQAAAKTAQAEAEKKLADVEKKLAEAEARATAAEAEAAQAKHAAAAAGQAATAAAPAPAPAGGGDTAALEARVQELQQENEGLLKDLEEINEDMLAQEEEYMERIQELEDKLAGN